MLPTLSTALMELGISSGGGGGDRSTNRGAGSDGRVVARRQAEHQISTCPTAPRPLGGVGYARVLRVRNAPLRAIAAVTVAAAEKIGEQQRNSG